MIEFKRIPLVRFLFETKRTDPQDDSVAELKLVDLDDLKQVSGGASQPTVPTQSPGGSWH